MCTKTEQIDPTSHAIYPMAILFGFIIGGSIIYSIMSDVIQKLRNDIIAIKSTHESSEISSNTYIANLKLKIDRMKVERNYMNIMNIIHLDRIKTINDLAQVQSDIHIIEKAGYIAMLMHLTKKNEFIID